MKMTGGIAFTIMQISVQVSPEDRDLRIQSIGGQRYARVYLDGRTQYVHRVVMRRMLLVDLPKHLVVDHINKDKLDNRRENLRLVNYTENSLHHSHALGKSGYRHVIKRITGDREYRVVLSVNRQLHEFGTFEKAEDAAFRADVWVYRALPDIAELNFPERIAEIEAEAMKIDNDNWKWQRKTFYNINPHANVPAD